MSTYAPKRLCQTQPTASYTTAYTVPASTTTIVKDVIICNPTTAAATLDLALVASGGTAGVSNVAFSGLSVAASETKHYSMSSAMAAGGTIQPKASVSATLTLTISGVEVV
jgi:hypothetical protein